MSENYLIYLDVCCLNRPLDDLEQTRMRLEAEAITEIIQNCENGQWQLINSDSIEFEVERHSDSFKQERVKAILEIATVYRLSRTYGDKQTLSIGGRKPCAPTVTDFSHNVGANRVRPKCNKGEHFTP